ncbi:MAG: hypothetical protein ABIR16_01145 [Dokdonella sp.]
MLRSGPIHACSPSPDRDGNVVAITLRKDSTGGIVTWSGSLNPAAVAKSAEAISRDDYVKCQTTHFPAWFVVWEYFDTMPEYRSLLLAMRLQAEQRIAAGLDAAGPSSSAVQSA